MIIIAQHIVFCQYFKTIYSVFYKKTLRFYGYFRKRILEYKGGILMIISVDHGNKQILSL